MRMAAVGLCLVLATAAPAADTKAIAVADFDYSDGSGEAVDQSAQHRARMAAFADLLRADLARRAFAVTRPACAAPPCTARSMPADELIAAARQGGAHYLLYGGIHKMSTLVQWGEVQIVDLDSQQLLLRRTVSFRGDSDEAFARAAAFVGDTVNDAIGARR
uniref:DUF2380 domain-containing protein n=1 Tax=Rhodopseudomonas palustris (strain BisA53) TaxID=316055 RepID=Q07PY0_RHOP5